MRDGSGQSPFEGESGQLATSQSVRTWWAGTDSNRRRRRQQIYSLPDGKSAPTAPTTYNTDPSNLTEDLTGRPHLDPDLAPFLAAWPRISKAKRTAFLSMFRAEIEALPPKTRAHISGIVEGPTSSDA